MPEPALVRAVLRDGETFEALLALRVPARFDFALAHHCHLCADAVAMGLGLCHLSYLW